MACSREIDAWKETTNLILTAKREKKLTWDTLAAQLGCNPCFLCSVCLGENLIDKEKAGRLCTILDIPSVPTVQVLSSFHPLKGQKKYDEILHDPVLYRLHEINCIYGTTIKEIIHEKFGDGIMSAIDFELDINKVQDPQGYDRVNITLSGKFLNYRKW